MLKLMQNARIELVYIDMQFSIRYKQDAVCVLYKFWSYKWIRFEVETNTKQMQLDLRQGRARRAAQH